MRIQKIEMPGLRELDAQLAELGTTVATRIAAKAMQASAELMQDAWVKGAPYDPRPKVKSWTLASGETNRASYGHLRENIRVGRVRPRKENAVVFKVTTGDAFWGYFYEFGTVTQPARPWARPLVESYKDACLRVQVDILREGIETQVSKVRRPDGRKFGPVLANGRNG